MIGSAKQAPNMFVRVVDPIDPWLDESRRSEQEEQFIGKYADISVAMTSRCCESIVLASLHGARDDVGYLDPGVFRFLDSEVELAGGLLNDTDANPPWPPEYNHAHHDIVREHHSVARAMINYYEHESGRLVRYQEVDVFVEIAHLLQREDVIKRFRRNARKRLRRLFLDGGGFRELWLQVARNVPAILDDEDIQKEFRRLWNNDRVEWMRIAGVLPQIKGDPNFGQA
jgi:hypothetical protein